MIEFCAVGHLTHSACNICRVCSPFPKISWGNLFREVLGEPYTSYTGYTRCPDDATAVLPRCQGTSDLLFFYLQRFRELVGAEIQTHKEERR